MNQLNFNFNWPPLRPVHGARGLSLEERFRRFHEQNPHIYAALRDLALQLKRRGRRRYGLKSLFEVLRWHHALQTDDPNSDFKLDNNWTAFYARELMDNEPDLDGFFETRTQRWIERRGGRDA